jgi:autotransporter-associated beta strand protein
MAYGTNNVIGGGQGFVSHSINAAVLRVAVAGSTSRLDISSPLGYTSSAVPASINKFGDGELVLSARGFLPRPVYLNSGTLTLAGGANTLAYAVATAPTATGTNTTAPTTASALYVSTGGVLELNGNDQAVGGLFGNAGSSIVLPGSGGVVTNSSVTAATLTALPSAASTFAGSLTGNLNFVRAGIGGLTMTAPNTYTGSTVIAGGTVVLQDLGTLENTSRLTIIGTPLIWNDTGLVAVSNRLPATAPIDLLGGSLSWSSRTDLTSGISTGTVTPVRGNSYLNVVTAGAGSPTMTIAGLGSRSTGATLTFAGSGTLGYSGTNAGIVITANPSLTNGIIGGWAVTNGVNPAGGSGAFVTYDPTFGVQPLAATAYATTFGQVQSGSNVRVTTAGTFNSGTNVANSLTVNIAGGTLAFAAPGDVLNLESGGILLQAAAVLGGTAARGQLTAGGLTATSGTRELFVHALASGTINSSVVNNPAGAAVALVLGQAGNTLTLTGSNTHTAGTYVNYATVLLSATSGFAVPGDLFATGGSLATTDAASTATTIRWLSSNQMAPTGAISIRGGAQIDLNGFSNSIAGLTFVNDAQGSGNAPPAVLTSTGTLTLTGPISVPAPVQAGLIPVIAGNLDLGGGNRTLAVDPFASVPNQIGLAINAGVRNGTLTMTGSGVVFLGGVSGPTASVAANAGTLVLGNSGFLGGSVTLGSAATLDMLRHGDQRHDVHRGQHRRHADVRRRRHEHELLRRGHELRQRVARCGHRHAIEPDEDRHGHDDAHGRLEHHRHRHVHGLAGRADALGLRGGRVQRSDGERGGRDRPQ